MAEYRATVWDREKGALSNRARGARRRHMKQREYDRRKAERYRNPDLADDVSPVLTIKQWVVMFALDLGALRTSHYTAPGATVSHQTTKSLERMGYVVVKSGWAELTPVGRARIERGW